MPARPYAHLSCPDAPTAVRRLEAVGFETVRRQDGADGSVQHAEVCLADAVGMVASDDAPYARPALVGRSTGQGLHLPVDDVDGIRARALAAGTPGCSRRRTPSGARAGRGASTRAAPSGASARVSPG